MQKYGELLELLLKKRGIREVEDADIFLNPSYERDFHDPFLMRDMEKACVRIFEAMEGEQLIVIYAEVPSSKVYEDDKILAFLDISPVNLGHSLVIPKEHFRNALETPDTLLLEIIKIGKKIGKALQATGAEGINMSFNNESASGQVIFHTHMHVIPRFKEDGHSPWKGKRQYYSEDERGELAKKISASMS